MSAKLDKKWILIDMSLLSFYLLEAVDGELSKPWFVRAMVLLFWNTWKWVCIYSNNNICTAELPWKQQECFPSSHTVYSITLQRCSTRMCFFKFCYQKVHSQCYCKQLSSKCHWLKNPSLSKFTLEMCLGLNPGIRKITFLGYSCQNILVSSHAGW